jgi:Flp pilus assembly protein TadG
MEARSIGRVFPNTQSGMFKNMLCLKRCRLLRDQGGNVAIVFALMAIVLMLAVGAAVDIGRWLHARDQTQSAADAAVLAGGRWLQTNSTDTAGAIAAAQNFYKQETATRLPVVNDSISFGVSSDGQTVYANGTAYIKTPFLGFVGINQLPIIPLGQQPVAQATLAVGGNGGQNLEVAMMLDITGSMLDTSASGNTKIADLITSATDLVNIIVWSDQSQFTSKVAIAPFTEDIRLPNTTAINAARGSGLPTSEKVSGTTYYLSDCVVERTGTQKYTDAAPGAGQYVMGHYTTSSTGSGKNKKGVCVVGSPVQPLTSDKTTLLNAISSLQAGGGTAGHLGTAWAWYTLSPNWNSLWPSNGAAPYGSSNLQKIAILMTDGDYNTQYSSAGISVNQASASSTYCPQAANGCSGVQAASLCSAMKAAGITIYTVGFTIPSTDTTAINLLTNCASDPNMFYSAADGTQLQQAFRDIAIKLSSLYISK